MERIEIRNKLPKTDNHHRIPSPQSSIDQVGNQTAYAQQCIVLRQLGEDNPEPRLDFITDVKKYIKKWQTEGNDVILMLDANEAM
jgi:hypothetical protein